MSLEKLEGIREKINKAREIKKGTVGFINDVLAQYRQDRAKINENKRLSDEGKKEELSALKAEYETEFLKEMLKKDEEVNALLDEAKSDAEMLLTSALPEVPETQQKLFDMTMKDVESRVTFAIGTKQALEALETLLDKAEEPLFAQQATEKFMSLAQTALDMALSGEEKVATKHRLGNMYQQLSAKADVEGAVEARDALDVINALRNSAYAVGYVQQALEEISQTAAKYVNDPEAYFQLKESVEE